MFSTLRDAWKIPEIRKKIIFTVLMLLVIRLGSSVPVPYMNREVIQSLFSADVGILGLLNLMGGAALQNMTIFGLSISPYITASIIIQLLTIAIPSLEEIIKDGEEGRKKMNQWTKYGAIILAAIQAIAMTRGMFREALEAVGFVENSVVIVSLVAGTAFLIWIGDLITEKGVGNGISLIIFIGIVSQLPSEVVQLFNAAKGGLINIPLLIVFLITTLIGIFLVVALQEGERRVPVQYAKRVVGRKMYGGQSTHIPLKVLMAGVIPVIFASSLLAFPQTIAMFLGKGGGWVTEYLTVQGKVGIWVHSILQILLIVFFTYFYTAVQFNTVEYAKNLQQQGGFIPGIRPGRPTSEYLNKVISRITFIGAIALAIIATVPIIFQSQMGGFRSAFGGTSIIIVVGVALETVKQIESQMLMRHYKGFLN